MTKRILIPIVLVVVAVLLIVRLVIFGMNRGFAPVVPATSPTSTVATTTSTVVYTNSAYGFSFTLPASWERYTIVTSTWTGYPPPVTHGPMISIRSPLWTAAVPTQDIPIMVFTLAEWSAVSSGTMSVSAAPIPPSELGRNSRYVFALPARYNYAYPAGFEEVQSILDGNPLHAF